MDELNAGKFYKSLLEKINNSHNKIVQVVNSGDDEFEFWVGEELFGRVDVYYTTVDYLVPKE